MSDRARLLARVVEALGDRDLVWSGLRGDDVEPLRDVPQLSASYAITGVYQGRPDVKGLAYEQLTRTRIDPEIWDISDHQGEQATVEFRRALLGALSADSALLPYRSSSFLSAIHFARQERCENLGLFGAHQSAFEHKPYVESAVGRLGIPRIPWRYIADEDQLRARDLVESGTLLLRRSRTSGGEGFVRVKSPDEIADHWPKDTESFVSVAPFIENATPVNVGATVWPSAPDNDHVTVHFPSVQLIGISSCVTREFGYCGNDFGAAKELDRSTIDQIEVATKRIGEWLRGRGYLGTFGVDYLVKDGVPLFTEVNARFQGSTRTSCRLSVDRDEACLMLEHVAAMLQLQRPAARLPLRELVDSAGEISTVAVHWTGRESASVDGTALHARLLGLLGDVQADSLVPNGIRSEPGSLVGRFNVPARMTRTGYDLDQRFSDVVQGWSKQGTPT